MRHWSHGISSNATVNSTIQSSDTGDVDMADDVIVDGYVLSNHVSAKEPKSRFV